MTRAKQLKSNQIRIIGGQWRGRKLNFPDLPGLRPTSDRIRETLFNWLRSDITGASCLDLFAGSGALGLEALSRNADNIVFVDSSKKAIVSINQNLKTLGSTQGQSYCDDALHYVKSYQHDAFDIVFLDPPFNLKLLGGCLFALRKSQCIKKGSLIYVEYEKEYSIGELDGCSALKEKKTSSINYGLYEVNA